MKLLISGRGCQTLDKGILVGRSCDEQHSDHTDQHSTVYAFQGEIVCNAEPMEFHARCDAAGGLQVAGSPALFFLFKPVGLHEGPSVIPEH